MDSTHSLSSRRFHSGISLIERLLATSVLGILATVTTMAVSQANKNTQLRKLEPDVKTLIPAIKIYVSTGGSLGAISDHRHFQIISRNPKTCKA